MVAMGAVACVDIGLAQFTRFVGKDLVERMA
jgi:hypothetical protein